MNFSRVTDNYAVSAQISRDDVADLKDAGFATIICNRPDNEDPGQATADDIRVVCEQLGVGFFHVPVTKMPVAEESINAQRDAINGSDGPVLAYCRSGQRSFVIWQAIA